MNNASPARQLLTDFAPVATATALGLGLAFNSGGYFAGATGVAALCVLGLLVPWTMLIACPASGARQARWILIAALGAFVAWVAASSTWSDTSARSLVDYERGLLYFGIFVLFASAPGGAWRVDRLLVAFVGVSLVVCTAGLLSRLLPELLEPPIGDRGERLSYPISYWNSVGLLAGLGVIACLHLSSESGKRWAGRAGAAAIMPAFALTIVLAASRAAVAATAIGVVVYLAVARPRLAPTTLIAGGGGMALVIALIENESFPIDAMAPDSALDSGRNAFLTLGLIILGTGLARAFLGRLFDRRLERVKLPRRTGQVALVMTASAFIVAVALALTLGDAQQRVEKSWDHFADRSSARDQGTVRLTQFGNNGRLNLWRAALRQHRAAPMRGTGAGTFADWWYRRTRGGGNADDAHSLYVETLAELGWVGFALLLVFLLGLLGAVLHRARGPSRAPFAAVAALVVAWLLAAAVDWQWEVPAVTGWIFVLGGASVAAWVNPVARLRIWPRTWVTITALAAVLFLSGVPYMFARSQVEVDAAKRAFAQGNCKAAQKDALRAIDAMPSRTEGWEIVAYCQSGLGDGALAARAIQRAIARAPNLARLHYNAALIAAARGRDPRPHLAKANHLAPASRTVIRAQSAFAAVPPRRWPEVAQTARFVQDYF